MRDVTRDGMERAGGFLRPAPPAAVLFAAALAALLLPVMWGAGDALWNAPGGCLDGAHRHLLHRRPRDAHPHLLLHPL